MANIVCQSCGHENEPGRIFCQNCGIRLEVPSEVAESQEAVPETAKKKGKASKVKPARKSGGLSGGSVILGIVNIVATIIEASILAALTAALIQAWRMPSDLPAPVAAYKTPDAEHFIGMVREAAQSPYPRQVSITQDQINGYLAATVKLDSAGMLADYIKFDRIFIKFGSSVFDTILQERALNHAFYLDVQYQVVSSRNSGQSAKPIAAYIGRLPIHPVAISLIQRVIEPAWTPVEGDLQMMTVATNITFTPGTVQISFPGGKKN